MLEERERRVVEVAVPFLLWLDVRGVDGWRFCW